jgi:hypothetical protein
VHVESGDPNWSSNTTMEEGSDFYVCNAGNATIARMRQDGTAVATRRVRARGRPLGHAVLNGIATSRDGSRLWVTYAGRLHGDGEPERGRHGDRDGGVLELPAF